MKVISTLELTYESIREETRKDPNLAKLLRKLMQDQSIDSYLTISGNILFRGSLVVIPAILQDSVL